MNPVLWLRVAAVITLIHAILHTIGGVLAKPSPGTATMVATTMRENRFEVFGVTRSYADFHLGLGLAVTIFLTVGAILFWQLGAIAAHDALLIRPLLAVLAIGYIGFAVVSYRFFFWGPVVAEVLIAICVFVAFLGSSAATRTT